MNEFKKLASEIESEIKTDAKKLEIYEQIVKLLRNNIKKYPQLKITLDFVEAELLKIRLKFFAIIAVMVLDSISKILEEKPKN